MRLGVSGSAQQVSYSAACVNMMSPPAADLEQRKLMLSRGLAGVSNLPDNVLSQMCEVISFTMTPSWTFG